jgi:hypothetical protein
MYQRSEIANIIGVSPRTLQRLIIDHKMKILPKKRLSVKDIKLIENKLEITILNKLKL